MDGLLEFQMVDIETDILVIGAGPAGLQAARRLCEKEADFFLLSKEESPCIDKPCGGFIPQRAIDELNISRIENEYKIYSVRMKFPGLDRIQVDFDEAVGIDVTREALGKKMLELIESNGTILLGHKVVKLERTQDHINVKYETDSDSGILRTKLVIDASGVNSVAIKDGFVRARIPNSKMGYAIQQHYQKNDRSTQCEPILEFYYGSQFSPKGYAWIFPRKYDIVVGTGGIIEYIRRTSASLKSYLNNLIENVESTKSKLKDASLVKEETALVPLSGITTPSYGERVLLVGDAAGHCSPISGEGIYYSMLAGQIAADVSVSAISNSLVNSSNLARYETKWRRKFGSDLKWGLWLQERFTTSDSHGGNRFLKSKTAQQVVAEMLVGKRSVRNAILRVAPAYIKSKVT